MRSLILSCRESPLRTSEQSCCAGHPAAPSLRTMLTLFVDASSTVRTPGGIWLAYVASSASSVVAIVFTLTIFPPTLRMRQSEIFLLCASMPITSAI